MTDIIRISSTDKTTDEQVKEVVAAAEKLCNTGPIIGEARELVNHLAHNILIRDYMFTSLGVDEADRIHIFELTESILIERDEEIKKNRKEVYDKYKGTESLITKKP